MDFVLIVIKLHVSPRIKEKNNAMSSHPDDKKIIIKTLVEAGYQLIEEGKISPDKLVLISKPLIPFEDYLNEETNDYLSVKKSKKLK
ncbi:MAG: hypothetical protein ACYCXK_05575 [Candidatus Humimicrobiaceae bacterium]